MISAFLSLVSLFPLIVVTVSVFSNCFNGPEKNCLSAWLGCIHDLRARVTYLKTLLLNWSSSSRFPRSRKSRFLIYRQYGNRVVSSAEAIIDLHRMDQRWIVSNLVAAGNPYKSSPPPRTGAKW
jgi:hypothetical protein